MIQRNKELGEISAVYLLSSIFKSANYVLRLLVINSLCVLQYKSHGGI